MSEKLVANKLKNVVYERYNSYMDLTFYIRYTKGRRKYSKEVKERDKLILIGIYDWKDGKHKEIAPSWSDICEICHHLSRVLVKDSERQKLASMLGKLLLRTLVQGG